MSRSLFCLFAAAAIVLALGADRADADLIAWDSFAYNTGTLGGNGAAANGWAGGWTGGQTVVTPGLDFPGLLSAGNTARSNNTAAFRVIDVSAGSLADDAGLVSGGKIGVNGTTLWISFIGQSTVAGTAQWGGIALFDGGTEKLFLGKPSSQAYWGVDRKPGTTVSTIPIEQEVLFLARIDFQAGAENIRAWAIPVATGVPSSEAELPTPFVNATGLDFQFTQVRIASDAAVPINFDELRFGTTYASVTPVPEPGVLAMVLVGLAALATRRRRQRIG